MIAFVSAILSLLSFRLRRRASLELEVIALRHQLGVVRRQCPRSAGRIIAFPKVGGLHHHYERLAA